MANATFGAGCFWGVEAVFRQIKGVSVVSVGYMGGTVDNPTYEQVCSNETDHIEVITMSFEPAVISFEELLGYFWINHDPTTWNRQGLDIGVQYRSVIFYHNDNQRETASVVKEKLNNEGSFSSPVMTEIRKVEKFWPAENYHQNYYCKHGMERICKIRKSPK
jgi:peptide-methionine (S)-S-oxide reductase